MDLVNFLINEYIVLATSLCMIFLLVVQPQDKRKDDLYLILVYVSILVTGIVNEAEKPLLGSVESQNFRYIFAVAGYLARPLIVVFLCVLIDRKLAKEFIFWIPVIVNAFVYLTTPFTHLTFYFENGDWKPGSLEYMMIIVSVIYMLILLRKMYLVFTEVDMKEFILLIMSAVLAVIGGLLDKLYTESGALYLSSLAVSVMVYYLYVHVQKSKEKDSRRVEQIAENELEIEKKNAELMISQIQPHFIYNTLSSVKYLIKDDPKLAEEALDKFSLYLRGNMSAIGKNEPVTFEMEMEQVENYTFIEKIRFPYITVEFDIDDDIFDIPALSVQPLVENAIKHGIRGKQDGYVKVKTWYDEEKNEHVVEVSDNGKGFDVETADMHVGLENVRKRLMLMVNGTMEIDSRVGEGTVILLRIPEAEYEYDF